MDAVHDHRALTAHRMTTGWDVSALSAGASDVIMALVVAEEVESARARRPRHRPSGGCHGEPAHFV